MLLARLACCSCCWTNFSTRRSPASCMQSNPVWRIYNGMFRLSFPLSPVFSPCRIEKTKQIPPYDSTRGRKCSYFRVENPPPSSSSSSSAIRRPGDETARQSGGADATGKHGDGDGDDHWHTRRERSPGADDKNIEATAVATTRRNNKRVILREIPEPPGLPRWSRYYGPTVTPR